MAVCQVAHRFHAVCVARHRPVSEALTHLNRTGDMSCLSAATCHSSADDIGRTPPPRGKLSRRCWLIWVFRCLGLNKCPCGGCRAAGAVPEDSDVDDMWFAAMQLVAAQDEDEVMPGDLAPELVEQPLVLAAPMVPLAPPPEPEPLAPPPEPEPQEQPGGPALAPEPEQSPNALCPSIA